MRMTMRECATCWPSTGCTTSPSTCRSGGGFAAGLRPQQAHCTQLPCVPDDPLHAMILCMSWRSWGTALAPGSSFWLLLPWPNAEVCVSCLPCRHDLVPDLSLHCVMPGHRAHPPPLRLSRARTCCSSTPSTRGRTLRATWRRCPQSHVT